MKKRNEKEIESSNEEEKDVEHEQKWKDIILITLMENSKSTFVKRINTCMYFHATQAYLNPFTIFYDDNNQL